MTIGLQSRSRLRRRIAGAIAGLFIAAMSLAAAGVKPEATATSRKGPIQLTLKIFRTSVPPVVVGQPSRLYCQVSLKNVGNRKLFVSESAFLKPGGLNWAEEIRGVFLVVRDANGTRPFRNMLSGTLTPGDKDWSKDQELSDRIDALKKRGLSQSQAEEKAALDLQKSQRPSGDPFFLMPGSSVTTSTSLSLESAQAGLKPVMGYEEIDSFRLVPGTYTVSAAYDWRPAKRGKPTHVVHWEDHVPQIRVETRPIKVFVTP